MHSLVTGGGGFLGRYIVEQLLTQGHTVTILARGRYPELQSLGARFVQGSVTDPLAAASACQGVDTIFHVAALPGIWGPWKTYYETNTLGTRIMLDAARNAGASRFIYTSSPSVVFDGKDHLDADESLPYPKDYLCYYPQSKALAEREVLASNGISGMATCALRPHLIWGPRDNHLIPRLIQRAKAGKIAQIGDGENLVSMSYVENTAAAHLQAAAALNINSACAGKAFFINEPEPVPLWTWVNDILSLAHVSPVKKKLSASSAYKIGAMMEATYKLFHIKHEPLMTRFLALQLSQSHSYRVDAARRDFHYQPLITTQQGMQRLACWLENSPTPHPA